MKLIEFTAANGFRDFESELDWKDGEDQEDFLARAGYERVAMSDGAYSQREYGYSVAIHRSGIGEPPKWHALVFVSDGDRHDFVAVPTAADLLVLRMRLVPFHAIGVLERFDQAISLLEKAFTAWHGHESHYPCAECDPAGHRAEVRLRLARAAAKQKGDPA